MPLKMFQDEQPQPNLLPMIDVIFQLVLFLMLGAQFQEMERNMNVKVPDGAVANVLPLTDAPQKKVINVDRGGNLTLDNRDIKLAQLRGTLEQARAQYSGLEVVVRGDEQSIYKHVANVLLECRKAEIKSISVAYRIAGESQPGN